MLPPSRYQRITSCTSEEIAFCFIKIWQVHSEFKLSLTKTNNKKHYPVNNFSKDLNAYAQEKGDANKGH